MKRLIYITILFLFSSRLAMAQLDSIPIIEKMELHDTIKLARIANLINGIEGEFEGRREASLKLIEMAKRVGNKRLLASAYFVAGALYFDFSRYDNAIAYHYKALALAEEINFLPVQFSVYNHLGIIASNQNDSRKAIYYFRKTYDIAVKLKKKRLQLVASNNLAVDYNTINSPIMALHFLGIAEAIAKDLDLKEFLPSLMGNKMECYVELKDTANAFLQVQKMNGYILQDTVNDHRTSQNFFTGYYYTFVGQYAKAAVFFEKNIGLISPEDFHEFRKTYNGLHTCYVKLNNYEKAHNALEKYYAYNDSLSNAEKIRLNSELENKHNSFKTEKELEIQKLNNVNQSLKLKRNRIAVILTSIILVLAVIGFGFVYKLFTDKRKANKILEHQNEEISAQKKEILDSINYSKRIQDGILPSANELHEKIGEHFVFYRSKDIVSGDFYWASKRSGQKFILACCDSTGHGVPGAFMSLLGYSLLTKSEEGDNSRTPSGILNYLNAELPKVFKSQERGEQIKDGMDVSICEIDRAALKMKVSGANNSIYHITNNELRVIKAQKHPVSASLERAGFKFEDKEIALTKGDLIVMFTDGFADQFGGAKGKKFKYKQLEDILLANAHLPLDQQCDILKTSFDNWKGHLEQVDDVCIVAVKI